MSEWKDEKKNVQQIIFYLYQNKGDFMGSCNDEVAFETSVTQKYSC